MSATKSTLAFLLGAAAGGAAALLLAPARGEDTRHRIRSRYDTGTGKLEDKVHAVEDRAKGYSSLTRDKFHDVNDQIQHRRQAVKEAFAEGKVAYRRELDRDLPNAAPRSANEADRPDFV